MPTIEELNSEKVLEDFSKLCAPRFESGTVEVTRGPFHRSGWLYATNRCVCFRRKNGGEPDSDEQPEWLRWCASNIPWGKFSGDGFYHLPRSGQWRISYERCKMGCRPPMKAAENNYLVAVCDVCNGTGCEFFGQLNISGKWFSTKWLLPIWELLGEEARCLVDGNMLLVEGNGYQGILMAIDNETAPSGKGD